MTATDLTTELNSLANPTKAAFLQGFFKTGKGQYAEGDKFLGITVPEQRKIARKYSSLELKELKQVISSPIHEHRLTALEILVMQYEKADEKDKGRIVSFYLQNRKHINNWDLVDLSAPYILGDWLVNNDRSILYGLVKSKDLWDRRIAVVSTYAFIRNNDYGDILRLAKLLMKDEHDLIHKAVGWMLREVGKRSEPVLEKFLDRNCKAMPRTMLRYAIERLPKDKRRKFLKY